MKDFNITPLVPKHHKKDFNCGNPLLDNYIHKQAKQDVKRKLSMCFVLVDNGDKVHGYYTLSNASIQRSYLPIEIEKKLPGAYRYLPVTLLGRLAIDANSAGKGLGELLLIDALKKSYEISTHSIGSMAVVVHPIDRNAIRFYERYGFIQLPGSGKMFLPMKTIAELY